MLGAEVVVDDGPACDGPAIVHLPHQGSCAVFATGTFPLALPESVCAGEAFGLHELGAVDEVLDGVESVLHVFDQIESDAALMAIRFVMKVDSRGLRVAVWVLRALGEVAVYSFDGREALHAKFRNETSGEGIEVLVFLLGTMPNLICCQWDLV